jgi:hypothetical protein
MTRDTSNFQGRVYMSELEELLGRKRATIRKWERDGILPDRLQPQRDEVDWRFWTWDQVIGIAEWIRDEELYPGKGFMSDKVAKRYRREAEKLVTKIRRKAEKAQRKMATA